jgi:RimJ/RimL family protein N-acetyltransferase
LSDLPESLETERLLLRRHRPSDAGAIARLLNDWEVVRWLSHAPFPYRTVDAESWIRRAEREWTAGRDYQFAATRSEDGVLVGQLGLSLTPSGRVGDLGYWFGARHWGQGLATEAAQAVVAFGFLDLRLERIQAAYHPDNRASGQVLVKAGLMTDGAKPVSFRAMRQTVDCPLFALDRHDYHKLYGNAG